MADTSVPPATVPQEQENQMPVEPPQPSPGTNGKQAKPVNGNDAKRNGGQAHQKDLWTKFVSINSRPFHFDLRENFRGRYLKITEVSDQGRRTILLPSNHMLDLKKAVDDALNENFDNETSKIQPVPADSNRPPTTLHFSRMWRTRNDRSHDRNNKQNPHANSKRFFCDLMENERGRFLKLVELQPQSRTVILFLKSGWQNVLDALTEVTEKFAEEPFVASNMISLSMTPNDPKSNKKTICSKLVQTPPKKFYFDFMESEAGRYCKIAEVQYDRRNTVVIPFSVFDPIQRQLKCFMEGDFETVVEGATEPRKADAEVTPITSRQIDAQSKHFFLDVRENKRGTFLKLSEVKDNHRDSVFIPGTAFKAMHDALEEFSSL